MQFYMVGPNNGQLPTTGLEITVVDPPTDETVISFEEVSKAVAKLTEKKGIGCL